MNREKGLTSWCYIERYFQIYKSLLIIVQLLPLRDLKT
jgi:hypothetical protein